MNAIRFNLVSTGYPPNCVYIIWDIPHDGITDYEIYRDNKLIASTELGSEFVSPTIFDRDHQTNLFKKDSTHQLMYVDEDVHTYQHYTYRIIAKRIVDNQLIEEIPSSDGVIEAL